MPDVYVAIGSYKRAGRVTTLKIVPDADLWVPESQAAEYEEHYPGRVRPIPDERDGNVCRKRNAILDLAPSEWVLILDDDIRRICYWEGGRRHQFSPDHFMAFVRDSFEQAAAVGARLWGVNQNQDPMAYATQRPFALLAPVLGPFAGHLMDHGLRYDEGMFLKEDYDHWLQHIERYRRTWRVNKVHYIHDHGTMPGGVVGMRTLAAEKACAERMVRRWGASVYRLGGTTGGRACKGNNPLNSLVRVPIPGM